jgi:hypothetical protein
MKKPHTLSLSVLLTLAGLVTRPATAHAACDQKIYDQLYKEITVAAIESNNRARTDDEERAVLLSRADSIETLRALCLGQKSSFESGSAPPTLNVPLGAQHILTQP